MPPVWPEKACRRRSQRQSVGGLDSLSRIGKFLTMTIAASIGSSKFETICGACGGVVVAPQFVEYFSEEQLVLNFWS